MTQASNGDRHLVPVAGGRVLDVLVSGPPDGSALVLQHGTPEGLAAYPPMAATAAARGLRTVSYARPGYVRSSPQPGRRVADAAADIAAILDHLGVGTFVTAGWSGGGPHALACAAQLPERCLAAATIAGVVPHSSPGLDWQAGMDRANLREFRAALAGPAALSEYLAAPAALLGQITGPDLTLSLGRLGPAADASAAQGDFADYLAASFNAALRDGIAGWRDDDLAIFGDWGISLDQAGQVPVTVWQGGQDTVVPAGHGEWLAARVPGAQARMRPGDGHLSLLKDGYPEIIDDLLSRVG